MNISPTSSELDLQKLFPFPLDAFQLEAIAALNGGKSVVVCAPTGSGKTLIGEYAIWRALAQGRRVFYTTPLKALSNQKLRDFRQQFGAENVGLITGDVSINREAPVLVMTTEIFRNMLYGTPIGEIGTSLVGVEAVVLDECHYMNDRQRGTVWEESIIYCPPEIQLVALSATIANSQQLTDWINQVHGQCELIYSTYRPVPLEYYFCNIKGIFPLLNNAQTKINPRLAKATQKNHKNPKARLDPSAIPTLPTIINALHERDMLPAIYFIFSRRGCDRAVEQASMLTLLTPEEEETLRDRIQQFLSRYPEVGRMGQVDALKRGIAAHHAGLLPTWKGLIEELFQEGLIKVVFATETLAAGINMPARTTVISSLSKRTDRGHRLLNPSEFLQISGRAGRRGMDELGYVVTVQTPFEGSKEAAYLATSGADPLVSQFAPSYGMVLNLLQTHSLEEAKELVERSFGQYLANLSLQPQQEEIYRLQGTLKQLQEQIAAYGDPENLNRQITSYEKLTQRLKEEKRLLKTLQQQAHEVQAKEMAAALDFAVNGTVLSIKGKYVPVASPLLSVLVDKIPGSGHFPYLLCLGQDNRWYVASVSDVAALHGEVPRLRAVDRLSPPPEMPLKLGQSRSGSEETLRVAQQIPHPPSIEMAPEVQAQLERVTEVQGAIAAHPIHQLRDRSALLKRTARVSEIERELRDRTSKLERLQSRHWEEFLNLIYVLQEFEALSDELLPTPIGQAAAAIRGDNELWLGLALMSEEFEHLTPPMLAAACAALVTEEPRPDSWVNFETSSPVIEALAALQRELRRPLIQRQRRHDVVLPVWLEYELIAIVEQWALGIEWTQLCENTSLDEGDVVRLLRRTLDFLSQLPHVPRLNRQIKDNAREAIALINRFPINEEVD
ncbi:DEAD/DEAH box helicase [Geitlerinema calcuttense]|uniref:DEAD/DEAH box helicase n=1 Tax=Geitlerinema calcuttense NRMC-F 0142 TaxID=2922238 RepID=A0ABT7LXA3_9CYAN|nr:DEAD/DEAH box helicase [Geitlerinema calcuttense]MDL5056637.1 DEAD/DEAH box helicase [Geitlerinema calcuttense NRMC-F 0142]